MAALALVAVAVALGTSAVEGARLSQGLDAAGSAAAGDKVTAGRSLLQFANNTGILGVLPFR